MRPLLIAVVLALVANARAANLHGVTGFDEFAEGHENIGRALTRRPSLAQDPSYLKHHQSLAHYLHDNPLARAELDAEADEEAAVPPPSRVEHIPGTGRRRHSPSELPKHADPRVVDDGGDD
jgi:hypothetical protein